MQKLEICRAVFFTIFRSKIFPFFWNNPLCRENNNNFYDQLGSICGKREKRKKNLNIEDFRRPTWKIKSNEFVLNFAHSCSSSLKSGRVKWNVFFATLLTIIHQSIISIIHSYIILHFFNDIIFYVILVNSSLIANLFLIKYCCLSLVIFAQHCSFLLLFLFNHQWSSFVHICS